MTITSIAERGFPGDPLNQFYKDVNAAIAEANVDIAAAEESAALALLEARIGRGTATLLDTNTTVVVTHGLGVTPAAGEIVVCPIEAWGAATQFWTSFFAVTMETRESGERWTTTFRAWKRC